MSARYVPALEFSSLFRAHLLRIAGGSAALALLAATGCTVQQEVCTFDTTADAVTLENASRPWICRDGMRFELIEVGETDSSQNDFACAEGTYEAKTASGAPCAPRVNPPGVVDGRPLRIDGEATTAPVRPGDAWTVRSDSAMGLLPADRAFLAARWLRSATYEHASVASFARFTLDLMRFGAPPALLIAASEAGVDEVRHAELSFSLARRFDGEAMQPDALGLPTHVALSPDLPTFAADTFREGCVGETLAAVRAAEARAVASDAGVIAVFDVLVADEGDHAQLAWSTLRWAIEQGGEPVRSAVRAAAIAARAELSDPADSPSAANWASLRSYGVLAPSEEARALLAAWDAVIAPALDAVLRA